MRVKAFKPLLIANPIYVDRPKLLKIVQCYFFGPEFLLILVLGWLWHSPITASLDGSCRIFHMLLDGSLLGWSLQDADESVNLSRSCCQRAADHHYSERRACSIHHLLFFSPSFTLFLHTMLGPGAIFVFERKFVQCQETDHWRSCSRLLGQPLTFPNAATFKWLTVPCCICLFYVWCFWTQTDNLANFVPIIFSTLARFGVNSPPLWTDPFRANTP